MNKNQNEKSEETLKEIRYIDFGEGLEFVYYVKIKGGIMVVNTGYKSKSDECIKSNMSKASNM